MIMATARSRCENAAGSALQQAASVSINHLSSVMDLLLLSRVVSLLFLLSFNTFLMQVWRTTRRRAEALCRPALVRAIRPRGYAFRHRRAEDKCERAWAALGERLAGT